MDDEISKLPEALLLKILSLLPRTKDVVATMVLSKRWQHLWMMVPKLVYDDSYQNVEYARFANFVDRSLVLHEAPVIETLHFKLGKSCGNGDIRVWIKTASKCSVRELIVEINSNIIPVTLPKSLYTCCGMLVTLKLSNAVLVDQVFCPLYFPSLKKMTLVSMTYPDDEFFSSFISSCPALEDLVVEQCEDDNLVILTVKVASLKSLSLYKSADIFFEHGFVIDAPCLESLHILDYSSGFCFIENNMPKIVEAVVDISDSQTEQLLGSITSAKRLYLCLPNSKDAYPFGSVFHCLVDVKLCTCETQWLNPLMCLLRDSSNLQALKLEQCHSRRANEPRIWNEPSSFPEYLLSSLETFKWVKYHGTEEEKEVAAFILRTASCLKKATIISVKSTNSDKKLEMLQELSLSSRRSPSCQLVFK